jgi:hypothetical protein
MEIVNYINRKIDDMKKTRMIKDLAFESRPSIAKKMYLCCMIFAVVAAISLSKIGDSLPSNTNRILFEIFCVSYFLVLFFEFLINSVSSGQWKRISLFLENLSKK